MKKTTERICLVPLTNTASGTERVVWDIASTLAQQNRPVCALIPGNGSLDAYAEKFTNAGIDFRRIGVVHGRRRFVNNILQASKLFRQWNPSIVHFHCPHYRWGIEIVLAACLSHVPHIIRTEQNPLMSLPTQAVKPLLSLLDARVSVFTYVSEGNRARFDSLLPSRAGRGIVIHNGIDPSIFFPITDSAARHRVRNEFGFPANSRIAVFVGNFGGRRPLGPIFRAFHFLLSNAETKSIAENWRVLIIGQGEDEKELPECLGIERYVHFIGRQDNIERIVPHCDLYVSASHFEGLAISMLEAWASGLPVLVTRVDGVSDVIGNENFLAQTVSHGDDQAYATAWYEIMTSDNHRLAVQKDACKKVRVEFTTQKMMERYLNLYS